MKKHYDTKIGRIIEKGFDSRSAAALFNYIMSNGMEVIKKMSDDDIRKNLVDYGEKAIIGMKQQEALMKTAVQICNECSVTELMEYIRCYLPFEPQVREMTLYKEDFEDSAADGGWINVIDSLKLDMEEVGNTIQLWTIIPNET